MKRLLLIMSILFFLFGCTANKTKINQITQEEAYHKIKKENVIILDVRTSEEYQSGYIKNAININVDDLEKLAEKQIPDKNKTILVYCRSGNRSKRAAMILMNLGYKNVYDFGGINTWTYGIENYKGD
mgnify:FL=1